MPKKETSRSIQAANTKQRILSAAVKLFEQYGVQNVTINDISEAAQCSTGNIYHYFQGKGHIIACLNQPRDDEYTQFKEQLDTDPQYSSLTSEEKLISFFVFVCGSAAKDTENLSNLYIYALKFKEQNILMVDKTRALHNIYSDLFQELIRDGRLDEDADLTSYIQNMVILCRGILMDYQVGKIPFDVEMKARELITAYLKGTLKQPTAG